MGVFAASAEDENVAIDIDTPPLPPPLPFFALVWDEEEDFALLLWIDLLVVEVPPPLALISDDDEEDDEDEEDAWIGNPFDVGTESVIDGAKIPLALIGRAAAFDDVDEVEKRSE